MLFECVWTYFLCIVKCSNLFVVKEIASVIYPPRVFKFCFTYFFELCGSFDGTCNGEWFYLKMIVFLIQTNLAIRNFLVALKLFLNAKSSISLWSKWQIGLRKWFLNTNLFLIKQFLNAKFDCTLFLLGYPISLVTPKTAPSCPSKDLRGPALGHPEVYRVNPDPQNVGVHPRGPRGGTPFWTH